MTSRNKLKRKEVDDVLGGEEMWKHADATAGQCIELHCNIFEPSVSFFLQHRATNATII
jgi:hypothetical protein